MQNIGMTNNPRRPEYPGGEMPLTFRQLERWRQTMSVNIELLRLDRQTEINLLADLQEICQVVERRAFGLMYECEINKPTKITKILTKY